jgi:hypothetical protein
MILIIYFYLYWANPIDVIKGVNPIDVVNKANHISLVKFYVAINGANLIDTVNRVNLMLFCILLASFVTLCLT